MQLELKAVATFFGGDKIREVMKNARRLRKRTQTQMVVSNDRYARMDEVWSTS